MEHHLLSTKPHLFFLTETQVGETTDSKPFSVPSYCLYSNFKAKAGCCAYVRADVSCSRVANLESPDFSSLWLRLNINSQAKYFCAVYLSPNSTNYQEFFDYLTSKVEHILSHSPFAEISILGDFNVHHQQRLSSTFTSPSGELAFQFALLNDLDQIVNQPTRIPDRLGDRPSILDLFLTTNPSNYSISVSSPLGSSDHCLISSSSSITQVHSEDAPGQRRLWHFADADWESPKMYYFDFPWNDYCFRN